jgi:hypothetical protein
MAAGCAPSDQTFIRIASGPAGGSWYPLGAKQAEIFSRDVPGVVASSGPGGGIGNIRDVDRGEAEIGFTYGHSAYNAYAGRAPFTEEHSRIRHLATLYPAAFHAAVRPESDIHGYADLGDKNLSPGKLTDSGHAIFELILAGHGIDLEQVRSSGGTVHHVSYSDSVALMKDGHIDLVTAITSLPQATFLDLQFRPGVRFLPIEDSILELLLGENPGYVSLQITGDHYESVATPVTTLGAMTTLIINQDIPDDTVYNITKSLWEAHDELLNVTSTWQEARLERAVDNATIPVHPGAMRYYREQGISNPSD